MPDFVAIEHAVILAIAHLEQAGEGAAAAVLRVQHPELMRLARSKADRREDEAPAIEGTNRFHNGG